MMFREQMKTDRRLERFAAEWSRYFQRRAIAMAIIASIALSACILGPSRDRAIKNAVENVKETMAVALPDLPHPEPYRYTGGGGDCALFPGLNSTKEALRYQAEVLLPVGDNGLNRQAKAIQHWINKGAELRTLPYENGPPNEVYFAGGTIMAFAMNVRGRVKDPDGPASFYIVVTTPCVPKEE